MAATLRKKSWDASNGRFVGCITKYPIPKSLQSIFLPSNIPFRVEFFYCEWASSFYVEEICLTISRKEYNGGRNSISRWRTEIKMGRVVEGKDRGGEGVLANEKPKTIKRSFLSRINEISNATVIRYNSSVYALTLRQSKSFTKGHRKS